MPIFSGRLANSLPFSNLFRKVEQEIETVVRVLQPGPLGIVEHKFSAQEINEANSAVRKAVENWRRIANLHSQSTIFKDYIQKS